MTLLLALLTTVASAAKERYVTIQVVDTDGAILPTARILHPDEGDRRRVNIETGKWRGMVLYFPDGTELFFKPGTALTFEVSAAGYKSKTISHVVEKKKALNELQVVLEPSEALSDVTGVPSIGFKHDQPLDR